MARLPGAETVGIPALWTIIVLAAPVLSGQTPASPNCQIDALSPQAAMPYAGGVREVNVRPDQWQCVAQGESTVDWVAVSVAPPGTNRAPAIRYSVQPNLGFHARSASVSIGGQPVEISQEAGPLPGIAGPSSLEWTVSRNVRKPEKKILNIGSDDPELDCTAAANSGTVEWLSVKKSAASRTFEVAIRIENLKPGDYAGQIVVHAAGARNDPLPIPVHVKVLP